MIFVVAGDKSSSGSSKLCARRRNNTGVPITRNLGPPEQTACSWKQRNNNRIRPKAQAQVAAVRP